MTDKTNLRWFATWEQKAAAQLLWLLYSLCLSHAITGKRHLPETDILINYAWKCELELLRCCMSATEYCPRGWRSHLCATTYGTDVIYIDLHQRKPNKEDEGRAEKYRGACFCRTEQTHHDWQLKSGHVPKTAFYRALGPLCPQRQAQSLQLWNTISPKFPRLSILEADEGTWSEILHY